MRNNVWVLVPEVKCDCCVYNFVYMFSIFLYRMRDSILAGISAVKVTVVCVVFITVFFGGGRHLKIVFSSSS